MRKAQDEPRLGSLTAAAVFVEGEDLHRIRASLATDGVEVVHTAGLDEAIQTPVPVILLDADGHQDWATALRKAVEMRPTARVIVLARHADERMWVDVRSLGAHDLLPKPFHASEVRSVVLGAFQGSVSSRLERSIAPAARALDDDITVQPVPRFRKEDLNLSRNVGRSSDRGWWSIRNRRGTHGSQDAR